MKKIEEKNEVEKQLNVYKESEIKHQTYLIEKKYEIIKEIERKNEFKKEIQKELEEAYDSDEQKENKTLYELSMNSIEYNDVEYVMHANDTIHVDTEGSTISVYRYSTLYYPKIISIPFDTIDFKCLIAFIAEFIKSKQDGYAIIKDKEKNKLKDDIEKKIEIAFNEFIEDCKYDSDIQKYKSVYATTISNPFWDEFIKVYFDDARIFIDRTVIYPDENLADTYNSRENLGYISCLIAELKTYSLELQLEKLNNSNL